MRLAICLFLVATSLATLPARADEFRLALPVDCALGKTCFVQKLVDVDPGPGVLDYRCTALGENGHTGTDIRVLSAEAAQANVTVMAAAAGTVGRTRDGVADKLVLTGADAAAASPIGLGNAVVLDHANGYQTIYAHMRKGSVKVRAGDQVEAGAPLGILGYSGAAAFAHVHFEVRFKGELVDPFLGTLTKAKCLTEPSALGDRGLWTKAALEALSHPPTLLLQSGFAGTAVDLGSLERGPAAVAPATSTAAGLVFYGRALNLLKGDRLRLRLEGPVGFAAMTTDGEALDRRKLVYVGYLGRKLKAARWPPGTYRGRAEIVRDGAVLDTATVELTMR